MTSTLNYNDMLLLDAEDLAEGGIRAAYDELLPTLRRYVPTPDDIEEALDATAMDYRVRHRNREYVVYSEDLPNEEGQSWGRATSALFTIVNSQLEGTGYQFYAINGGNDLGGMFLTPAECEAARRSLPRRLDWPYLPDSSHPWYGQPH